MVEGSPKIPSLKSDTSPRLAFFSSENKILLFIIFTISVALLIVAFAIYSKYQAALEEDYHRFGELIAKVVSVSSADRMGPSQNPQFRMENLVDNLLKVSDDVAAVEFYDTQGQIIYENHKALPREELVGTIDFSAPLRKVGKKSEVVGEVHVKLTGKTMREISFATKTIVMWLFMSAWFISILAVSLNTYFLSKHLRTLVRGVKRLSTGDFGYKISEHDLWGELKHLAESFNDMSMRLRAYEDQNLDTITFERNKLEAVLLSIADGVVVCDISGEAIIINEPACHMLGVKSSHVLIGTSIRDYVTVEDVKCFEPVLKAFEEICLEYHNRLPDIFRTSSLVL
jgi:PAS domain-containing protein